MADTPISIRIPEDILADIDKEAAEEERSRHWVIIRRLKTSTSEAHKPLMSVEYVDPAESVCMECGCSFGVHLKVCSLFVDPNARMVARAVESGRPKHDPAACRIYNCGMCKAMKEK
jgi:hypothetical protein